MVLLINPHTGLKVDASPSSVERLLRVGFREHVERVVSEDGPVKRGPGRPKKSDD